ncbi:unnamed protein product [Closterium sp. NIES-54]
MVLFPLLLPLLPVLMLLQQTDSIAATGIATVGGLAKASGGTTTAAPPTPSDTPAPPPVSRSVLTPVAVPAAATTIAAAAATAVLPAPSAPPFPTKIAASFASPTAPCGNTARLGLHPGRTFSDPWSLPPGSMRGGTTRTAGAAIMPHGSTPGGSTGADARGARDPRGIQCDMPCGTLRAPLYRKPGEGAAIGMRP